MKTLAFLALASLLALASPRAAEFRPPTPDELPGASETVLKAIAALQNKEAGSAVALLKAAAAKDDADAQFVLGLCTQYGEGVTLSKDGAREWYAKAAKGGQPAAQFFLAQFLLDEGAVDEAIEWLEKAGDAKFFRAHHQLSDLYRNGSGSNLEPDLGKSREWLLKASGAGDALATYRLAAFTEAGDGELKPDAEAALVLYEKAAEQGLPDAMLYLGRMHESGARGKADLAKARAYYENAEKLKSPEARFRLGRLYEFGAGVEANPERALFYYRKGAEQNHPACLFSVGHCYAEGIGVAEDIEEALGWYRKAADLAYPPALYNVAVMQEFGMAGLKKDPGEAFTMFVRAGELGDVNAQNRLGVWYRAGDPPAQKDNVAAAAWFSRASGVGFPAASVNLGLMYEEGAGLPQNPTAAGQLYQAAAARGHALGMFFLARLLETGNGSKADPVGAYVLYSQAAAVHKPAAEARDTLAKTLTPEQLADAKKALAERGAAKEKATGE